MNIAEWLISQKLLASSNGGGGQSFLYKVVANPADITSRPTFDLGSGNMTLCSDEAYPTDELIGFVAYRAADASNHIVDLKNLYELDPGVKGLVDGDVLIALWLDATTAEASGFAPGIYIPDTICKNGLFVMTWLA